MARGTSIGMTAQGNKGETIVCGVEKGGGKEGSGSGED